MRIARALLSLTLFAAAGSAQTQGMPGRNDYTINNQGSVNSWAQCWINPGVAPIACRVSAAPFVPVAFLFTTSDMAPGLSVANPCVPVNTLDIGWNTPGEFQFVLVAVTDGTGIANVTLPAVPAALGEISFYTQALVVDPACPFLMFSQAHHVWRPSILWACN